MAFTTSSLAEQQDNLLKKPSNFDVATDATSSLKNGIWLYFLLLIFEGALRKWVLPGLSNPILIIRDPIALWLLIMSVKRGLLPANPYIISMFLIGVIGLFTAVFFGHGNFLVALYGSRIMLLHFPLIFVIGRVFNHNDVIKVGKVTLWISIPMAILITLQFYSPQSAWVNRGVGGDLRGAGFSGALGYFRPPGTFSFTNGNALFFSFVAPFLFYFWLNPKKVNRFILFSGSAALLMAIPFSISRSLFFSIAVSLFFAIIAISKKPNSLLRIIIIGIGVLIALSFLRQTNYFQTATKAFITRFEGANEAEGGLEGVVGDRYLGGMIESLTTSSQLPFFGYGLGIGTSVGSTTLLGKAGLQISENEWGRVIGELGLFMGFIVIFIRLSLCFKISLFTYRKLLSGDILPWMLLSFFLLNIPQGQWAQPTALGFGTMIGGLTIASLSENATTN